MSYRHVSAQKEEPCSEMKIVRLSADFKLRLPKDSERPQTSWSLAERALVGRQLIDLVLLHEPSCPPSPLHPPPVPTSCPFSTLRWKRINIRPRMTLPRIHSFPGFNPAIPPMLSSRPFERKSPRSTSLIMVEMDSRNGLPRQ